MLGVTLFIMEDTMMSRMSMLLVVSTVTLGACAAPVVDENSTYYRLPVRTTVVLQQDLPVPAGHARVFLQYGKVVEQRHLKPYQASCNFEQREVSDGSAVIKADRFTVTAVSSGEDYVVQGSPLIYAGWQMSGFNDSVSMVNAYVRYELSSPNQPQVMRLTCHGGFDFQGRAQPPSLTEINAAVGEAVKFELPQSSPQS
jgi:hypothetical protein